MAIDVKAWEGYRVVWLRPQSGQAGEDSRPTWPADLDGRPLAEVKIDPEHNEPLQFVRAVEQAVLQVYALPDTAPPPQYSGSYREEWIDWINRLSGLDQPLILALEGYDQITNPDVHALTSELLEYQPESLQIVLVCQAMPPLPLPRLRARRALLEVVV